MLRIGRYNCRMTAFGLIRPTLSVNICACLCRTTDVAAFRAGLIFLRSICVTAKVNCSCKKLNCCEKLSNKSAMNNHSVSTLGWCCPIICTVSGHCRRVMQITPHAGKKSKRRFPDKFPYPKFCPKVKPDPMNGVSSNTGIGNTPSGTTGITRNMWIIATSIHSNTDSSQRFVIGHFQLFTAMCKQGFIRKIGQSLRS